ncbi:OLC1v1018463C3 [Oldenlandia corymbosa var. corymbosa]|uniref:OLC1v1018463C3 n=1 Tax=Oldenlandia corymbosa var. corymbosa TaxID=529605 RepID=A0AAV1EBQ4_OLDCO|nr:OLC1v1018463C3 [Oldenlandia corymbosa var. corymbosa]
MGITTAATTSTAELVRGVFFFKSRSGKLHHGPRGRNSVMEKKRWSSVKSYLCGDGDQCNSVLGEKDEASVRHLEFSSLTAEENSACTTTPSQIHPHLTEEDIISTKSSEATVTQPVVAGDMIPDEGNTDRFLNNEPSWKEKQNSTYRLFRQEDAAITIQSAFRNYRARGSCQKTSFDDGKQKSLADAEICSPAESLSSSIKVQTGDSTRASSVVDVEGIDLSQPMHKRVRIHVTKIQEEWDGSTASSSISKMRIQNRIEAATRRERALAYAFAQQLRVCAKKKRTKTNSLDTNMSRSWLERWMATRQPENSFLNNNLSKRIELFQGCNQLITNNRLDGPTVEEESCGSNEISTQISENCDPMFGDRAADYLRPAKRRESWDEQYVKATIPPKCAASQGAKGRGGEMQQRKTTAARE